MNNQLRIALFVEDNSVKSFEYAIIQKLQSMSSCKISLIINHKNPSKIYQSLLYRVYMKFDKMIYGRGKNYLAHTSLSPLKIETIECTSKKINNYHLLQKEDIEKIKLAEIDLILKFNSSVFKDDILSVSKYGIWEYAYGKEATSVYLAGLKAIIDGDLGINVKLQKLPSEKSPGYVLDTFYGVVDQLSIYNNQNLLGWKTHLMMLRNIQRMLVQPDNFIAEKEKNLDFFKNKEEKYPGNIEMVKPICRLLYKNISSRIDRLFYKAQWNVYYAENEPGNNFQRDLSKFIKIPTPNQFFWADPFVIDKGEKSYIFFEDYIYKTKKGHISVIEYDHNTKEISSPTVVLDTSYHQSYPFLLEYENAIYMIPEGSKDKDIKLYKAVEFPYKWQVERVFFKGQEAVDVTLFYHNNKWWLFTNMIEVDGQSLNEELYIYYCDDFRTDTWLPHAMNPVISSIQSSRPAGKIIEYKGEFYRPSQNSLSVYGRSTNFNKIIELTPSRYKEEIVAEITPDFLKNCIAIHTYNSSKKITVIDCVHKIRRFF